MDEAAPELLEESYIHHGEDDTPASGPTNHPDTWTDEKWILESLKGKAKELIRLKHDGGLYGNTTVQGQREVCDHQVGRSF